MKTFTCLYLYVVMLILAIFAPAFAAEPLSSSEESVITGMIQRYEQQKTVKTQAYQLVNDKKERFKIIGPKSILDQITIMPEFDKLKFKITGKIIKKDDKKGVLISKFEVCVEQLPKPSVQTSEIEIKK